MTDLTKVTVNLTPKSMESLERAAALTGDTKTDSINRALEIYASILEVAEAGGDVLDAQLFVWRDCEITVRPGRNFT